MANAIPPAPWTAAPWGDNSFDIFDADGNRICEIVGTVDPKTGKCLENDSIVSLLVAAPAILAALRMGLSLDRGDDGIPEEERIADEREFREAAAAAIAKATGAD